MDVHALILAALAAVALASPPAFASPDRPQVTAQAPVTAEAYVERAARADMFEVESAKIALEKTKDPSLRDYASRMLDAHTKSTAKLKDTLKAKQIAASPPATLDPAHEQKLAELRASGGEAFDRRFRELQLQEHEAALKLHNDYAKQGDNEALKQFAREIAPVVQQHLSAIKGITLAQPKS